MKKIITLVLSLVIIVACAFTMLACTPDMEVEYADATDLIVEDYGIAVNKNNATLLTAVNSTIATLIENGKMEQYVDYYSKLDDYSKSTDAAATAPVVPEGLTTSWNFGNATEAITVFTEAGFAPFEYYYNENIVGVDIAIMSEVALSLGKKIVIKDIAFDNIPTEVQNATGDAVGAAGLSITDERAEVVNFSSVYFSTTLVILSEKGSNLTKVSDLAGLKVGVQKGTTGDLIISKAATAAGYDYVDYDEVEQKVLAAGVTVNQYEQYALAFADLKAGRIDAILMDKLPALSLLKTVG